MDDARTFVAAFAATHRRADFNTVSGKPFAIDDVRFVTREQAEQMMRGESLQGQVTPGDLVCIMTLSGPFTGEKISRPSFATGTWHPAYITLVFDAHTGYLLNEWYHD